MALRSMWKGSIRFSLVSVPVEAFTALEPEEGEVHLNQLHDQCHSRIRYKKTCPIHGEVENAEIVTGYEYEKDQYVVVDRKEVEQIQSKGEKSLEIKTFIEPDVIDPMYYDGRTYFLAPRPGGEKPYAVLSKAMDKEKRYGIATVVLHGKEQLVLIRPVDGVLTMTMLHYQSQIRSPEAIKEGLPNVQIAAQELKLAEQLIEASTTEDFDFGEFEDHYTDQLRELIESKVKGKKIVVPTSKGGGPPTINLMDALKKSMQQKAKKPKKGPLQKQRRKKA